MKKLLPVLALLLSVPLGSLAQDDEGASAQRARIAAERAETEAAFRTQEKACYGKFAVNDCLNAARSHRREVLADLRRQEMSVNDAQRKRKAAEHLRAIEERSTPEKRQQSADQRTRVTGKQQDRKESGGRKTTERSSSDASRAANAAARQEHAARRQAEAIADRSRRAEEAAQNVKSRQQRQLDAEDRKAGVEQRLAERKKPKAQPLPVPP